MSEIISGNNNNEGSDGGTVVQKDVMPCHKCDIDCWARGWLLLAVGAVAAPAVHVNTTDTDETATATAAMAVPFVPGGGIEAVPPPPPAVVAGASGQQQQQQGREIICDNCLLFHKAVKGCERIYDGQIMPNKPKKVPKKKKVAAKTKKPKLPKKKAATTTKKKTAMNN